jgi:hypothetical protein
MSMIDANKDGRTAFENSLLECLEDLNKLLPGLSRRYETSVILTAMATHMGSALQVLLRKKLCDVRQVGLIIRQIEGWAFNRPTVKAEPSGPAPDSTL